MDKRKNPGSTLAGDHERSCRNARFRDHALRFSKLSTGAASGGSQLRSEDRLKDCGPEASCRQELSLAHRRVKEASSCSSMSLRRQPNCVSL